MQPRGTIELGTGVEPSNYLKMPSQKPLEYGSQGGFDIQVNAKMTGLQPGNPSDILDPTNPRTRFHVEFADTGVAINRGVCPNRLAYVPVGNGEFVLQMGTAILYEVCYGSQTILNRDLKVTLEIMDSDNGYAMVEQIVTPVAPVDPGWPDAPDSQPCPPPSP